MELFRKSAAMKANLCLRKNCVKKIYFLATSPNGDVAFLITMM